MTRIHFRRPGENGEDSVVDVPDGATVMTGALMCGFDGVVAECGGNCSCGTCHVYVDADWVDKLEPAAPEELDVLECVDNYSQRSRLSCQLLVNSGLDGLRVSAPSDTEY
jgi:2Fe-2S ferredoxin